MSQEILSQNKRRWSFHHTGDDRIKAKSWHAAKSKNKIFQKVQRASRTLKKFSPFKNQDSHRRNWIPKRLRKFVDRNAQPPTPHNTTQFIVDAFYYPTDPYIYEFDNNTFESNFQNHAMAGSMMNLMQQKLSNSSLDGDLSQLKPNIEEEDAHLSYCNITPKLRMTRSADDSTEMDLEDKNYDQYLKEAQDGKNLQEVIKNLVHIIRGKDNQINSLLTNAHK